MRQLRESVQAAEALLGSRELAWSAVVAVVGDAHGLPTGSVPDSAALTACLAPWTDPDALELLGAVHESLVADRAGSGTFYTPPALVDWILDRVLEPALADSKSRPGGWRVLDPSCGAGHFLLAVVRRLTAHGWSPADAVAAVHGVDLDPVAVAITRLRLQVVAPGVEPDVRVADGLGEHPGAPYDAVVGNPPFLGQLKRRTAVAPTPGFGPYTDTSGIFLAHALSLVTDGGRVALVQPLSLLAARDAAPVRAAVTAHGAMTSFWASATPVFDDASVLTCAPVITVGAEQGRVATWQGADLAAGPDLDLPEGEWGPLAAPTFAIPAVAPAVAGVLGDLGPCTADFRDQYYGLVPFVGDGGPGAPLVTTGLIDPAVSRWGARPARFAKTKYDAPTVDLEALEADGTLAAWARSRLVPKVLVATQGRVIEAVVDEHGAWLPSVPVLTLTVAPDRLWHALAVLLAPPVAALAAARYLGTAMAPTAIKLSARQVMALPLPADLEAWDRGAELVRRAQGTDVGDDAERLRLLVAGAEAMCDAYDDRAAYAWWRERILRA